MIVSQVVTYPIRSNYSSQKKSPVELNNTSFKKLLPPDVNIKLAFFDIDETLINWGKGSSQAGNQQFRNQLFNYIKDCDITSVYSSDRGIDKILPLIQDGTLAKPDYIVGNNGGAIYKNINGEFEEIKSYSAQVVKNFNKDKVRKIMLGIARKPENMFTKDEWAKVPTSMIPEGQKEFRGSKITEYKGHESPVNLRFIMAPEMYKKNIKDIEKALNDNGINASTTLFHYPPEQISFEGLVKYFGEQNAIEFHNHYAPRVYPDGSGDSLLISATDKGTASEFLRNQLGLRKEEVFAAGDGENDFAHANKGYYFGVISNAAEGLKKMIANSQSANILIANKPGAEGILEVIA